MTTADDDIHALIQAREFDFYGFIRERRAEIDDHLESCEACCERMYGWAEHLPKFLARSSVELPEPLRSLHHTEQLRHLKKGQCLPCGCTVRDTTWTREQASEKFYRAFAKAMDMPYENAVLVSELARFEDLPFTVVQLRRLRDTFWMPDMSSGSEEARDREEGDRVLQLPDTIGAFINIVVRMHAGMRYSECSDHWSLC